jgi:hypothetical protein
VSLRNRGLIAAVTLYVLRIILGVAAPPFSVPDVIANCAPADHPSRW